MLNLEDNNLLYGTVVQQKSTQTNMKNISKNVEGCRDGSGKNHTNWMAVCRQHRGLHLFLNRTCTCIQALLSDYCKQLCADNKYEKKDVGMRLLLPSLHPCTFLEIVFKLWVSVERTLGHIVQHMHVHVPANFILNFTKLPAD